ncbi:hypothetical protein KSP39_PZI009772 [Platanthera zijinensis]|uniref:Uncharacterized protein n=1 Tax=Platanthera zijinensis TaxID=2320716 RepID=A0AAP0BHZ2_9ASPA
MDIFSLRLQPPCLIRLQYTCPRFIQIPNLRRTAAPPPCEPSISSSKSSRSFSVFLPSRCRSCRHASEAVLFPFPSSLRSTTNASPTLVFHLVTTTVFFAGLRARAFALGPSPFLHTTASITSETPSTGTQDFVQVQGRRLKMTAELRGSIESIFSELNLDLDKGLLWPKSTMSADLVSLGDTWLGNAIQRV